LSTQALFKFLLSRFSGLRTRLKTDANHQADCHLRRKLTDTLCLIHQDLQAAENDAIKNDDSATAAGLFHIESEIDVIRDHLSGWGRGMGRDTKEPAQKDQRLTKEIHDALEISEKLREAAHIGGPETLKKLMAELKQQVSSLSAVINQ